LIWALWDVSKSETIPLPQLHALEARSKSGQLVLTEVEVRKGSVSVTSPTAGTLNAGQKEKYNGGVELSATGGADFEVNCEGRKAGGGPYVSGGLVGLLALIGVGAAIAIGIAVGDEEGVTPSSPVR
jgi:hypothetical protein